MRISRDKYLNDLVARKGNGMVKVVTGARRCGKTYLRFDLFEDHLRAQGVDALRYTCAKDNIAAYRLYTGIGHSLVGETTWRGIEFYAFESLL